MPNPYTQNLDLAKQLLAWSETQPTGVTLESIDNARALAADLLRALADSTYPGHEEAAWQFALLQHDENVFEKYLVLAAAWDYPDALEELANRPDLQNRASYLKGQINAIGS